MVRFPDNIRGITAPDGTAKARIERSALELFSEHGIDGVSTKSIAAKAGVSEGLIYRYFKSKDALAHALMSAIHDRLTDMINIAALRQDGLIDQISFITRHYCEIADSDWTLFRYHIRHLYYFKGLSEDPARSPLGAASTLLEAAMNKGELKPMDPVLLASMSLGVVLQSAQSKSLGAISGTLSERVDIFEQAVLAVLGVTRQKSMGS